MRQTRSASALTGSELGPSSGSLLPAMVTSPTPSPTPVPETRSAVKRRREAAVDSGARKPRALDVYSCWGGSTHFALEEGFDVIRSIDNDEIASRAHELLFPNVEHKVSDVHELEMEDIGDDLDLLMAWIPCSGTSMNSARFGHDRLGFGHAATGSAKRLFKILAEMSSNAHVGRGKKPMKPPKFVVIENPRAMLSAPACEGGCNASFFHDLVRRFSETMKLAATNDGVGYSHLEWLVLHSDVGVYHSPRAYVVAVRQDVADNIQREGLVILDQLCSRLAKAEEKKRGKAPGIYYCVPLSGEKARADGVGRMTSKTHGPFVVLQDKDGVGCGVLRLTIHAAVTMHGLPKSFGELDLQDTNKFQMLGLSAVQSARRVLQCIKVKLDLNSSRDSAGGGFYAACRFVGADDRLQPLNVKDLTSSFPDCGMVSITENGVPHFFEFSPEQVNSPLKPHHRSEKCLHEIVDRWQKQGTRMLTELTLEEMRQHVKTRFKSFCSRGHSDISHTDWHLKLMGDVMAAAVGQRSLQHESQISVKWVGHGGWHDGVLRLVNDENPQAEFHVPHVRYDDQGGRGYPSVLLPMTPTTGEILHMTSNGMEILQYKLKNLSVRERYGMCEGEWMVKGLLSDKEEEVDVAALFDEVKGEPVASWKTVIDGRLRHDKHKIRYVCDHCQQEFPTAPACARHHHWRHKGMNKSCTRVGSQEACPGCQGIAFLKSLLDR